MQLKSYSRLPLILLALLLILSPILGIIGCTDKEESAATAPEAEFTASPTSGTAPLEVQFTDQSTGEVTGWKWDFDNDGTVDSTEQSLSYTYDTPGTYTVSLEVTGPGGLDTETKTDYIEVEITVTSVWPMFRYNPQQTGRSCYTGPQDPTVKWSYQTGYEINGSPAVLSDGSIYVASGDGKLYAIDPDGTLKWTFDIGDDINSSPAVGPDGTIYVNDEMLYAINPDGTLKWTYQTSGEVSSPTISSDGTVFVSTDYKVYALYPDGSLQWSADIGGQVGWSSPAIANDGTVYVGAWDNKLYAINPDGSIKWSFITGGWINSTPAIGSDNTIYIGSWDHELYAINPDGSLKWSLDFPKWMESFNLSIADNDTIYVNTYAEIGLYAVDPNGTLKWELTYVDGDHAAIDNDGTVYTGTYDNELCAVNPDGTLKWTLALGVATGGISSPPAIGADGTIYICGGGEDNVGWVYAVGSS